MARPRAAGQSRVERRSRFPVALAKLCRRGYGDVDTSWSGKYAAAGSVIKLNDDKFRSGSYGFNCYLTFGGGFSEDTLANRITTASILSQVPVFFDCSYIDAAPENGSATMPVMMPADLRGAATLSNAQGTRP